MNKKTLTAVAISCLLAVNGPAGAEDIDLFLNPPAGIAATPNVLFALDNSANWGSTQYTTADGIEITKRDIIHQALYQVVTSPELTDTVRLGYMTFSTGAGGKVMWAVQDLTAENQTTLGEKIFGARVWQPGVTFTHVWKENMAVSAGDYVVPTVPNGFYYLVADDGTTGTTEPDWPIDGSTGTFDDGTSFMSRGEEPNPGFHVGDYVVPTSPNGFYYQVTTSGTTGDTEPVWPLETGSVGVSPTFTYTGQLDATIQKIESYNNAPYALMANEAYLYYSGGTPYDGTSDGDHDPAALVGGLYDSPAADSCSENIVILLGNGGPDSGENNEAEGVLTGYGGKLSGDPIEGLTYEGDVYDNYAANWADEFARFLASVDVVDTMDGKQNIVTHVINVVDREIINTKPEKGAMAFLESIADEGEGRHYYAKTVEDIIDALKDILNSVNATSSVFASTTLPVSVNVRGTNLNQIYMGVFRPDEEGLPYWVGNLKLYELAVEDGDPPTLYLADRNGLKAEDTENGFLVEDAVSYWTSASDYWAFHAEYDPSDLPDGKIVEKGAVAQKLRNAASRDVYTCTGGCGPGSALASTPFNTDNANITEALLGAASAEEREAIINWTRGQDLLDENDDADTTDARASVHGDVLHSRPAVINYNRNPATIVDGVEVQDENDILAFYGANDGTIRAIYGGKEGDSFDGEEAWAFIPPEFFPELKTLYTNNDQTSIKAEGGYKPYFADGHIGVYLHDADPKDGAYNFDHGDKVYLYFSMRRGGRLLYALDVSDPDDPKLLWKRSNNDTGYGELGQTWSEPKVVKLNINGTATDALVFGAGYDPDAEDTELPGAQGIAEMGRGIFVVEAESGDVIWQAGPSGADSANFEPVADMTYPIPSNVTVLDTNTDGYEDRIYVGDTGGQVWRVNMGDPDPTNWTVVKLASLADHSSAEGYRKFLYEPDVVYGDFNQFDYILLGSGDRENPDDTTVVNRFYMLKDRHSTTTITEADLYDATENLIQDGTDAEKEAATAALNATTNSGWYITLLPGEKVVSSAVTLAGSTFFNTNEPILDAENSCISSLGTARHYIVSYKDASATTELNNVEGITVGDRFGEVAGGGFPPSPVPVIVEIDGKKYQAVVSGTKVLTPENVQLERRERVYWYRENSD